MRNIASLSEEELELLIEQKILEILGDPDSGLELRDEFKQKLKERLKDADRTSGCLGGDSGAMT